MHWQKFSVHFVLICISWSVGSDPWDNVVLQPSPTVPVPDVFDLRRLSSVDLFPPESHVYVAAIHKSFRINSSFLIQISACV